MVLHGVTEELQWSPARLENGNKYIQKEFKVKDEFGYVTTYIHVGLYSNSYRYIYIYGIQQTLLSKAIYNKYIFQKEEKQQYIAVGTDFARQDRRHVLTGSVRSRTDVPVLVAPVWQRAV